MLRSFLIYLSRSTWARQLVTRWSFAKRAASRFVAGEKLEDAIHVIESLNVKGINATLDLLGEQTTNSDRAIQATQEVIDVFETIDRTGLKSNVSIKLTQIGLALDENLCRQNLKRILETAEKHATFVRIDMEDSPWTEKTIGLYRDVREECNCENVGLVIQSYLYRSHEDLSSLVTKGARVRLCKGAYDEPSELAFPKKRDVDANYDELATMLIQGALTAGSPEISEDGKIPPIPAIATHDEKRIQFVKDYMQEVGLPATSVEFQFLNGIRRDLQQQIANEGYPVRVYVPFGTEWYPYFTRRLAERPANLWFFLSNLLHK
jgi:proline dehydrogenase